MISESFISKFTRTSCTTTSTLADTDATVWVSQANGRLGEGVSLVYQAYVAGPWMGGWELKENVIKFQIFFEESEACDTFSGFFTYCFL